MGQCCTSENSLISEDYVTSVLKDHSFLLAKFTYLKLLNLLADRRTNDENNQISKLELLKLFPEFYEQGLSPILKLYYDEIFNEILMQISEPFPPIYKVILYLYPFISHEDSIDSTIETLYQIIGYVYKQITLQNLEEFLNIYIYFCTFTLNHCIWKKCDNHEVASDLNLVNTTRFNKENIKIIVQKIRQFVSRQLNFSESEPIVNQKVFKSIFDKWNLTSVFTVREFVYINR